MNDTTRQRFLRGLPGHGFLPPLAAVAAVAASTLPRTADAQAGASAAEVAAFAAEFWGLGPAARRTRWADLSGRAVGPAVARLAELEPGLDVPAVTQPDTDAAEVAAVVRELFALPAPARAARRFGWLEQRAREFRRWAAAARVVLRTDMPLARLEPRLFDWLAAGTPPGRVEYQTWVDIRDRWRAERKAGRERKRFSDKVRVAVVAACLLGFGVAFLVQEPHEPWKRSPTGAPTESNSTPAGPPTTRQTDAPRFTRDEVAMFHVYETYAPSSAPSLRYLEWVQAGRPSGGPGP